MSRNTFERFYLQRVALSEACGCAEAVIRCRDIEDTHGHIGQPVKRPRSHRSAVSRLKRLLAGAHH